MLIPIPRNTISSIGILYAVVAANYVGDVFACDLQRLLVKSALTKHIVLMVGALVWVSEAYDSASLSFSEVIVKSILLYVLFLLSCKSTAKTLLPMLGLILVDQVLRVWEQKMVERPGPHATWISRVRNVIHLACVSIIVLGCLMYAAKQRRDHGKAFTWLRFFFAPTKCRGV